MSELGRSLLQRIRDDFQTTVCGVSRKSTKLLNMTVMYRKIISASGLMVVVQLVDRINHLNAFTQSRSE